MPPLVFRFFDCMSACGFVSQRHAPSLSPWMWRGRSSAPSPESCSRRSLRRPWMSSTGADSKQRMHSTPRSATLPLKRPRGPPRSLSPWTVWSRPWEGSATCVAGVVLRTDGGDERGQSWETPQVRQIPRRFKTHPTTSTKLYCSPILYECNIGLTQRERCPRQPSDEFGYSMLLVWI